MPLSKKPRDITMYLGIGLLFVCLVVIGAFHAPTALESASHWLVFAGVSGVVFGYQLRDFWRFRATGRFWITLLLLFACHFALWVFYVHPHFGGDPRLFAGFLITFLEYVLVSIAMKMVLSAN
jgi:hypothetical protein